jgi:hypothetical protein
LRSRSVETSTCKLLGSDRQNTLAFVRHRAREPHYAFYDEGTASRNWTYRRARLDCIRGDRRFREEMRMTNLVTTDMVAEPGIPTQR